MVYSRWHCEDGLNPPENLEAAVSRSERMHASRFSAIDACDHRMHLIWLELAGDARHAFSSVRWSRYRAESCQDL